MPPDVREWLPEGHLAWFVHRRRRRDGSGGVLCALTGPTGMAGAAYEPAMMVALLLYAYARGMRSSRAIERACEEDVAYRVIAAQQRPDHATIARFVERHQEALAGLFGAVLGTVRAGGAGDGRGDRDRRHQGARQREPRREPGLRADRARDPRGGARPSTRPRMRPSVRRAAMSCRRSWPTRRAGASGCAKPKRDSTSSAASRPRPVAALTAGAAQGRQAPLGRGALDRVPRQRGLRGLPGARGG